MSTDTAGADFAGLRALVTGGTSGIGAAVVTELIRRGARVGVLDLSVGASCEETRYFVCDVARSEQVETAVTEALAALGGLDVLVNNAGIGHVGDVGSTRDEDWQRLFDVNVMGLARVTRHCFPALVASPAAAVVNVCSAVSHVGVPQRLAYSATKGAVEAMTRAMAADHVADGIRVNAVSPGTADTPWVQRLLEQAEDPNAAREQLRRRQPMGRLVSASEVAYAVAYLASPQAASTTGTVLRVDAGMTTLRLSAPE